MFPDIVLPEGHCGPQRGHMARGFSGPVSTDTELEQIAEQVRLLKESEREIAQRLGISGEPEDMDEVEVFFRAKALRNGDDLAILGRLHSLRLQYSRAQPNLPVELNVYPSPSSPPYHVDGSRFYAVLIGINKYTSYPLDGCVSDVRLMEHYLTEDLGVPRERIQLFLGSEEHMSPADTMNPSRTHIIDALLSIIHNPEILYGDNIIIYYSGHGSCYPFEEKDDNIRYTEHIEALCPIDRDTIDDDGQPVPDISDREFNTILTQISRAKGHRITVILDCCHSGSASRNLPEPGARKTPPTMAATLEDMLLTGDKNLRDYPGYQSILSRDWCPDVDSHVVLAACKVYQFAKVKEVEGKAGEAGYIGIFTDSLVRVLRSGYLKKETAYADLVHCFDKTSHQTPVVAGTHKDAHIWYQD
ncbi:uncharacterized protein ARMOST_02607 [Armillaria ostoyae]|uniref:Peptidase C14 caspase domain-containing protein n=1 Tax=Armillaria ostoyae TaxID=47428 RepID=A0A284QS60_ARMOS|nr:uncharacterized protein ARMOST_02607 [Armillaria ostoyae]